MNVLIVGALGQLGTEIGNCYSDQTVFRADLEHAEHQLDIRDASQVRTLVNELRPEVVFNCAAAHNLPECEERPELAFNVNALGARNIAVACREAGARMVHVSTDYVFGNNGGHPYTELDLPAPLNVYAATKLAGEHLVAAELPDHIIIRTAAMYGHAECRAKGGRNFVTLMLHLADTRPEVKVVTDEITTPTFTVPLAKQMRLLAEKAAPGLYHTTCQGACSWYEFAEAIFQETGRQVNLQRTTAAEFQSPVKRPHYSVLENKHACEAGLDIMPDWRDALREYLSTT